MSEALNPEECIAIIGMAGRFPEAPDLAAFWANLVAGRESIRFFSPQELRAADLPEDWISHPDYVPAMGVLDKPCEFDAELFGFSPREAEITDPQQRLFLECAWEALEQAGYAPRHCPGAVGVFGGARGAYSYFQHFIAPQQAELRKSVGDYALSIGNDRDFLCSRVAYKLNLNGPAVNVQTACSTSLVAVVMACQSLLDYQTDMALAGGAALIFPETSGYLYQEGMILSPDGHCRAFDASAAGTVGGNGVGIVVLKRLVDAQEQGDHVLAVIRGAAINNDGALKVGYTAPSVEGQARVIAEAQALADIEPDSISYVEAHGTGTALGDPIEVAALSQVFRAATGRRQFCAIGSLKTNIGHLDAAAGIASLIKTTLALQHRQIPPSLHFSSPNPKLGLEQSPFYVNSELRPWKSDAQPRRAGVSSFGIGGTNAHAILEEAPPRQPGTASPRVRHLLVLAAQNSAALEQLRHTMRRHLQEHAPDAADLAYTCQTGREALPERLYLSYGDSGEAAEKLAQRAYFSARVGNPAPQVVFLFSGQGSQYPEMGLALYQHEPRFRETLDQCARLLQPELGLDMRSLLYPELFPGGKHNLLDQTAYTQPALFALEYALAQLWLSWGVEAQAMVGHSIGEYVAACLAGVFTLEDALHLVSARGRLMQAMPAGAMLAVPLSEAALAARLPDDLDLALINAPELCVVAGPQAAIRRFARELEADGIEPRALHTSHAFHSAMMEDMLEDFLALLRNITLQVPQRAFYSNLSGDWISAEQATDPNYWAQHLRRTVRFADTLDKLLIADGQRRILLEVGPGRTLTGLLQQHPRLGEHLALASLPHPKDATRADEFITNTLGQLWLHGLELDWQRLYTRQRRLRLPLPTYPFQRRRYQLSAPSAVQPGLSPARRWDSLLAACLRHAKPPQALLDAAYHNKQHLLETLGQAYLNRALRALGLFTHRDSEHSWAEIAAQAPPHYQQLLRYWLEVLLAAGELSEQDGRYSKLRPCSEQRLTYLQRSARRAWQDEPVYLAYFQECAAQLPALLAGELNPHELLFPAGTQQRIEQILAQSPLRPYIQNLLAAAVEALARELPEANAFRVLEIGAGTGMGSVAVLPHLPAAQTEYVYTDISPLFLQRAQERFTDYDFIRYQTLDIERKPQAQDLPAQGFDVVLAVNVLHATRKLDEVLTHVRGLLAPGGVLLLCEITEPMLDFAVMDGLLMPVFQDGERDQGHPFCSAAEWQARLANSGFRETQVFPPQPVGHMQIITAWADTSGAEPEAFSAPYAAPAPAATDRGEAAPSDTQPESLEARISAIWRQVLGLAALDPAADFFELGGDSLMAVQLATELRRQLGLQLSTHALLEHSSVERLWHFVQNQDKETAPTPFCLVEIQAGDKRRKPLFLVHPAGGHVYFYSDLARSLPAEQPVYGLQAVALNNVENDVSVEAMAERYLAALRSRQANGPYRLGGASFGGMVAFEIVRRLQAAGEEVELLALIDTPAGEALPPVFSDEIELLAYLLQTGAEVDIDAQRLRAMPEEERLRLAFQRDDGRTPVFADGASLQQFRQFLSLFQQNVEAMQRYRPQALAEFQGQALFFKARQLNPRHPPQPETAWQSLLPGLRVCATPGNHITMNYLPQVRELATILARSLD